MSEQSIAIIIVTYNSRHEIDACLASLLADLGKQPAEILIVDSASSDGTCTHLTQRWPQVKLLAQSENQGFAKANNLGIQTTDSELVLLLNPDTMIKPGAIQRMIAAIETHPQVGVVGPKLLNPDQTLQPSCRDFPTLLGDLIGMTELYRFKFIRRLLGKWVIGLGDHNTARQVDWVSGACLFIRRAAIAQAGLMDEGYFMYTEELDWQLRMSRFGWAVWFEPTAEVIHSGGASTAPLAGKRIIWQYRSIFRFYRLHRSPLQRAALRGIVWLATWPKVIYLAVTSRGNTHRKELLKAFWQVLWM